MLIKKIYFPLLLLLSILFLNCREKIKETVIENPERPNIVVILADDLGFSDLGCYGSEIQTPNLNYLAQNGLRFTEFYNTSRCCPSRASLLTGLYNHEAGIGEMTTDRNLPGYRGHVTRNAVTIAEVLKSAGYHTAMSGKWHISNTVEQETPEKQLNWLNHHEEHPLFSPIEQYPTNRGFEKYYGNIWGVVDFFDPFSLVNGTEPVAEVPKDYYHTDAINDTAVAYIKTLSKEQEPFFLYVAETAPHWPLMAPEKTIEKYKDTYLSGWEAIREARYKKMIEMGLIDTAAAQLSPRIKDGITWEENPDKEWDSRAMAVHAAMIDQMDQGIGRIINVLKETDQLDNTLIVFLSDNGASAENAAAYGPGFDRPSETRDGRDIIYATKKQAMPGPETTYSSIGDRRANVANTPYKYWKAESYEGGIHTPMIAFWPKGITVPKGSLTPQVGHVMDFMATFLEMAGGTYPSTYNGNKIVPLQGKSLLPVFKGEQREGHAMLFNEHFGAKYVRSGDWKLVKRNKEEWHLYNIANDWTELINLAEEHPEMVQKLDSMWQDWATTHNVLPKREKEK